MRNRCCFNCVCFLSTNAPIRLSTSSIGASEIKFTNSGTLNIFVHWQMAKEADVNTHAHTPSRFPVTLIARLSQGLWTTTPKNFNHPNRLSTRCVVESFNSRLTIPLLDVVVQKRWLNLANIQYKENWKSKMNLNLKKNIYK